jgi:hypothetical protein
MADYLSQLVAKNLALQENIHPRLRGRFEPSPDIPVDSPPAEVAQTSEPQPVTSPVADSAATTSQIDRMSSQVQPYQPAPRPSPVHPLEEAGPSEPEPPARVRPRWTPEELMVQPYRGRLNPPPASPPSPADQPASWGEAPAPNQTAPIASPLPTAPANQPGIQPENPPPIKPERPPISANVRLPGSPETLREITIERRSKRTLISTIKTAVELPQEGPAGSLPPIPRPAPLATPAFAREPAEQDLHPTTPPYPDPAPRSVRHETAVQDLRPVTPPLPDLTPRSEPASPAPTINVTIGRIEVRATPSVPNPPRKPAPAPKIMSLDEYLHSRSNGGGR